MQLGKLLRCGTRRSKVGRKHRGAIDVWTVAHGCSQFGARFHGGRDCSTIVSSMSSRPLLRTFPIRCCRPRPPPNTARLHTEANLNIDCVKPCEVCSRSNPGREPVVSSVGPTAETPPPNQRHRASPYIWAGPVETAFASRLLWRNLSISDIDAINACWRSVPVPKPHHLLAERL
jgi:hypothetical protein